MQKIDVADPRLYISSYDEPSKRRVLGKDQNIVPWQNVWTEYKEVMRRTKRRQKQVIQNALF